ncbi:MAG: hypothetical protein ACREMJ_03620, partial [Gemmatimonadales bacterium]
LDVRRLGQALFPDSGVPARLLARVANVDVRYARAITSSFHRSPFPPSLAYQLALGGVERFRREQGVLAASASQTTTLGVQSGVALPLGLRVTASYQEGTGVTWLLRNAVQVPIRTESRAWPVLSATWSLSPGRTALGRVLSGLTARLGYRERESGSEHVGVSPAGAPTLSRTTERALAPSLSLTWAGGLLTTFDAAYARNDRLAAGSLFRTTHDTWSAAASVTLRPPAALARLPSGIRVNARYAYNENVTCLRPAGGDACVPHVDSRQTQAHLTLDTDFPPNISAGFQMAYVLNDERQANRKNAQLVLTAFVNLTSTVGQLR